MSLFILNEYGVSPARPAPSQPRQDRKVAAAGGRSGAMQVAYPFFLSVHQDVTDAAISFEMVSACTREFSMNHLLVLSPPQTTPAR